jgi:hypothetical protein
MSFHPPARRQPVPLPLYSHDYRTLIERACEFVMLLRDESLISRLPDRGQRIYDKIEDIRRALTLVGFSRNIIENRVAEKDLEWARRLEEREQQRLQRQEEQRLRETWEREHQPPSFAASLPEPGPPPSSSSSSAKRPFVQVSIRRKRRRYN